MALTPGTRLGPFEITAQIGVGGMGEVYKATDTNLKRAVAIKVLPVSVAADAERLARFQREAEVLASLNHPNIASIYGLERSGATTALVMELVEGPTLADRIALGAIPIDEALTIAKQIAEALEAAHEQGIIHRDLKPANIKVRSDGTVKVLDFGLAKAVDVAPGSSPNVSMSPTITSPAMMTGVGMILGTAAYMSPEQAKGRPADKRSDVWAFGSVLYEMLTGKRAFDGDDIVDVLGAVTRLEPDWTVLPVDTPPSIRVFLKRALVKDARKRAADLSVAVFALEEAMEPSAPVANRKLVDARIEQAIASTRRDLGRSTVSRMAVLGILALGLGGVLGGIGVWYTMRLPVPRVSRMAITPDERIPTIRGQGGGRGIAITRDGSRIVYRGREEILVRALDRLEPTRITGLGFPHGLFVSPDGEWIGFFAFERGEVLKKVRMTGGAPFTIATVDGGIGGVGATWGENGTIVFATNSLTTGLQRVSANGGEITTLTRPDRAKGEGDHRWPEILPGGDAVLFTIEPPPASGEDSQIAVLDLRTLAWKVLLRRGAQGRYVTTGHIVYSVGDSLWAVPFDLNRLETTAPMPVVEHLTVNGDGVLDSDVTTDGTLVYLSGTDLTAVSRTLVWVDRAGHEDSISAPPRPYIYPRLSPDGTRVVLHSDDEEYDLWVWDGSRGTLTRLTFEARNDSQPVWMPDGKRVVFASTRGGGESNLYMQAADGTGSTIRLTESDTQQLPTSVSADGTQVIFHEGVAVRGQDLKLLTLPPDFSTRGQAPAGQVRTLLDTKFDERGGMLSPDNRWLAYESDSSGRFEVYVRPFPNAGDGQWQISTNGGVQALWSRDGKELFYVSLTDGALMKVDVASGASTWVAGAPTKLFSGHYYDGGRIRQTRHYDITSDGKHFLMMKDVEDSAQDVAAQTLVVVQNWFEELKRLVPTK